MSEMRGRASQVAPIGEDRVLRTGGRPEREAAIMAAAAAAGFPVPRVHEVRPGGLVLERIAGGTMGDALRRQPWQLSRRLRQLAELHERLHRIPFEGRVLVHLDLHPENVLMSASGPVVIDWTNARAGEAATDVALSWIILATSSGPPGPLLAHLFRRHAGLDLVRAGVADAAAFRLADPNVTDVERGRVRRLVGSDALRSGR